ncbi:ubiquinone biosynthesis accessory factor UbiJ [Martelella alba]|uniref:Ubiquinone biosynthesis accessory factor UbiJ n=1 Tax=Martelella alba TaxID=2590451 RepID=A0ABY2SMK9_9HYPH|nr:SCP2 sterol-binding domain-containing protein [Martelella alba]TKI07132.1 hypothetical protein FCN80_06800 [Martelella alba]
MLMQLLAAGLEIGLKRLLYRDRAMKPARQRLKGKTLCFEAAELAYPVILLFGETQVDVLTAWEGVADCTVRTHLSVLPALRRRRQLTSLIRDGSLQVDGDAQVVQQFVALLDCVEWDPTEILAPYLGDVLAEGVSQRLAAHAADAKRRWRERRDQLGLALTEEWRLTPSALELAWYDEEVAALADAEQHLAARLDSLENRR